MRRTAKKIYRDDLYTADGKSYTKKEAIQILKKEGCLKNDIDNILQMVKANEKFFAKQHMRKL